MSAPFLPHVDAGPGLDDLLRDGGLHNVFQPFIDLDSGAVIAYEALLRGPAGTRWASPMALIEAARETGRLADLEHASLRASLAGAATSSDGQAVTLFVNLEPRTLTHHLDVVLDALSARAEHVQVVVEITERALAADLAGVLAGAERLRAAGCAIALDDVGAEPASLAFIPLLRPEVVKLDLRLLRTVKDPATVTVAGAVQAYAEQSGAEVVAEGIETPEDLTRALVLGATLGQGWLWSRGERRLSRTSFVPERFTARSIGPGLRATPYELIGCQRRVRRAPKHLLIPLSKTLEMTARQAAVPPIVLAAFEHARFFRPSTVRDFTELAATLPFVGALGVDMPARPAPGVRGVALSPLDPLASEWTVVVLGAHTCGALVARDLGDTGADGDREFEFVVSYDRALVTAAAQSLAGRLTAD
ncbi:EAL domain-containing protein (putative c-di-GMP-specific phosphodiesterase class I) [Catenuloplanes nepalensis]|uniref:EAL domain-containing protein (Putative c-di-GMP-specific phosphodiesterase class I) n=1 Tax=Catenuloplanes nepalensis TaxID=587533 RepID=A0ABT9MUD7_9ACTN|nr:EAL domain-containing protein [Catenuloplanes nepalensis]MDP9795039.1 EAL domain-containing protein (putative c-di-GMP-specific phosphodiesterase class I) [Catenuloplanes nepalensis]